jgi:hypothetical protein
VAGDFSAEHGVLNPVPGPVQQGAEESNRNSAIGHGPGRLAHEPEVLAGPLVFGFKHGTKVVRIGLDESKLPFGGLLP